MAQKIPFIIGTFNMDGLTHSQRICRLYKLTLNNILTYNPTNVEQQRTDMLRVRYLLDKNKNEKNTKKQKKLYEEWVTMYEKYKHGEPFTHPESPDGTAYARQVYIPRSWALCPPMESWYVKEWQLENNISGLKEWEWDKRPEWRNLITRNYKRSHLIGYEDDI